LEQKTQILPEEPGNKMLLQTLKGFFTCLISTQNTETFENRNETKKHTNIPEGKKFCTFECLIQCKVKKRNKNFNFV